MKHEVPLDTNGRWSRPILDAQKNIYIVTTLNGPPNIRTKVVTTKPYKNRKGERITSPKAIRRAIAHHNIGYFGKLECKMCDGKGLAKPNVSTDQSGNCAFCTRGIPKAVCMDCQEVLPVCACVRKDSMVHRVPRSELRQ